MWTLPRLYWDSLRSLGSLRVPESGSPSLALGEAKRTRWVRYTAGGLALPWYNWWALFLAVFHKRQTLVTECNGCRCYCMILYGSLWLCTQITRPVRCRFFQCRLLRCLCLHRVFLVSSETLDLFLYLNLLLIYGGVCVLPTGSDVYLYCIIIYTAGFPRLDWPWSLQIVWGFVFVCLLTIPRLLPESPVPHS